jgi:hypothetical protein
MSEAMLSNYKCAVAKGVDNAIVLMSNGVAPSIVGTLGAAFEPRIVDIQFPLSHPDERLFEGLVGQIDRQIAAVIDSRSVEEFDKRRDIAWPKYVRALRALSDTIRNFVPDEEYVAVSDKAFDEFQQDLEKVRGKSMTDALINQAQFTLWTLRRLRALGQAIDGAGSAPENRGADYRLNKDYRLFSLWSQFHMDVTLTAMHTNKEIPAQVQDVICDGLRAAVNAYAIGEEALALRTPVQTPQSEQVPYVWDEEDEELLASSMRDLDAGCEF